MKAIVSVRPLKTLTTLLLLSALASYPSPSAASQQRPGHDNGRSTQAVKSRKTGRTTEKAKANTGRRQTQTQPTDRQEPRPAVVRVVAPEGKAVSYGSGTLVGLDQKHGLVLTNWHVVRDAAGEVRVEFPDGFRSNATVLRTDRTWDLAALLIWRPDARPVQIAAEAPVRGDRLTIAGYGRGRYREATGKVVQFVSPGKREPFEMVEVEVAARNGDSGGPIFNAAGEVAGVLFGSADGRTNGSHCGRVRWFVNGALTKVPGLARSMVSSPAR